MKKILLILGLATVAGFAGCSKDTTNDLTPSPKPMGNHTLKASVVTNETRTQLGEKGEQTTPVLWTKGDNILIVDQDDNSYQYLLEEEFDGLKTGNFTVSSGDGAAEATSITAFYPYQNITWDANPTMALPAEITYTAGRSFGTNMNPMYGTSDTPNEIAFSHMAGVINLQLTSLNLNDTGRKVTKIVLSSTDNQLAGKFDLVNTDKKYTLAASEIQPSKTITMDCSAEGGVEMTQTPSCFLFVVPAGTYTAKELKFTITVNDGQKDGTVTLTMSAGRTIALGEIVNIKATAVPNFVQVTAPAEEVSAGITDALQQIADATGDDKPTAIQVTVAAPQSNDAMTVEIPQFTAEQQSIPVTIQMPEITSTNPVTIQTDATNAPTNVTIISPATVTDIQQAPSFTINMPQTTVSLTGTYKAVDATTADNTLVIEKGTKIGTLTLTKGNVVIQGYSAETIQKIEKAEDWTGTITYQLSSTQDIVNMAAEINSHKGKAVNSPEVDYMVLKDMHFELMNDIDMTGIAYIPMGSDASYSITASAPGFAGTFNGNKHIVRNIDISGNDFKNNRSVGLFGTTYNATIKDLTVENVTVQYASKWAGGLIGDMQGGTITNCHVKNADFCKKADPNTNDSGEIIGHSLAFRLGGLVGICRSTCNISNCSVDGANIRGYYSIGGLIGACNVNECKMTIANCSVDNIVIEHMIAGAYGNYYDSSVLLGDCDPAKQITMTNITLGKWEIKGLVKATETTTGWTNQTWAMFPYLGEKPSSTGVTPTLDGKALTITPLSEVMLTSDTYNTPVSVWGGEISALTPAGNHYAIYTAAEFAWMNKMVNEGEQFKGKTFTLERDIDLFNKVWVPMGSQNHSFTVSGGTPAGFYGTFDGQKHIISNVNVDVPADAKGLFGKLQEGAVLKNLTVKKVAIPLNESSELKGKWVGGMVGLMAGNAVVDNCHVEDVTILAPKMYRLGGLIGFINNSGTETIASVKNSSVKAAAITGGYALGGLVGTIQKKGTTIEKCSVDGIVLTHKNQFCWLNNNPADHSYDATKGYCFSSSPVVGDASTITLKEITVGTWQIVNTDQIEGLDFTKATWTHLPYVGEIAANTTLDGATISADTNAKITFGTQYTGTENRK